MMKKFRGLIVPLVTPFRGGEVDLLSLKRIIDNCVEGGADGFIALGTTAETPTLSRGERSKILRFVKKHSRGKFVIAGAGSNDTAEAAKLARLAQEAGADGVLSVCPYYNKPQTSGVIEHFRAVANAVDLPVVLYDVPSRTGIRIGAEATLELKKIPNVAGIKEATDDPHYLSQIAATCDDDFALYCGSDSLTSEALKLNAAGLMSAAANALPAFFAQILRFYAAGESAKAWKKFER
ncbi:MAG: 4-hydroxy-tetrahydrodipicolinate synthase, partial [Clostridia bacterium]|nr:4-hydroxy-tetrahydrodipicolinate synthase [Clostridia bacterium]